MFVLADIEWMTNEAGHQSPTQLAAIKVDEKWNTVDSFESFIRPRDSEFHDWSHVAYTGGTATDFLYAKKAYNVLLTFNEWLNTDDIILWWYDESEELYRKLVNIITKTEAKHKMVTINEYVYEFLAGEPYARGNVYRIAEGRGINVNNDLKHNSANDAKVMRELMSSISYPQEKLLEPLIKSEPTIKALSIGLELDYQYVPESNIIHKRDCKILADNPMITKGYPNLKTAIRKRYTICDCCKEEYRHELRERNLDTIERTQYTYIYTEESEVFHKYTCGLMLSAKTILGSRKYQTVLKSGKKPCKVCNPTPYDQYRPLPPQYKVYRLKRSNGNPMTKEEEKAVKRQKGALLERKTRLGSQNLSETEIHDVYTLTQPEFAFWAGQGYQTFHLRSCSKLQGLENLKGFKTYKQATKSGYTPCRVCKPTAKHDVTVSIPISNRVRDGERIEDIEVLCKDAGFEYHYEGAYLCIDTKAGKWRIYSGTVPVKVEHMNTAKNPNAFNYHKQPRLFLSFVDTFEYIKRHDGELIRKMENEQ